MQNFITALHGESTFTTMMSTIPKIHISEFTIFSEFVIWYIYNQLIDPFILDYPSPYRANAFRINFFSIGKCSSFKHVHSK